MLSHIIRLTAEFEREHGTKPTLLYLSPDQLRYLQQDFDPRFDLETIMNMLGMVILIDPTVLHPHVALVRPAARRRTG